MPGSAAGEQSTSVPLFLTSSSPINSASTCLVQVEFAKQEAANVASHLARDAALAFDANHAKNCLQHAQTRQWSNTLKLPNRSQRSPVMHPALIHRIYNKAVPVDLHLQGAAKPPSKGVASLAKQGSSQGLDTKESKDCF